MRTRRTVLLLAAFACAAASAQPYPHKPIRMLTASGVPDYVAEQNIGVFAPAIIELLYREILAALRKPEFRERFANAGVEPVGTTPQEFASVIKADIARMAALIRGSGIRAE